MAAHRVLITGIPKMNHRRLRLPAAMALLALAVPVLAADPSDSASDHDRPAAAVTDLQRGARELGESVRQNSIQLQHQVTHGVHQFRHQFTIQWYRTGDSIHRWLDNVRDGAARI
jgi:hypothetical protein